ncbi:hypothetical protein Ccrd_005145 [Cynara cardunculus var. scolymus]|uniref:Uncharacterized protein n=1 Tax=Cynara cardunculus var. scolymus TaxID=59895 RepID=A0A118JVB4_CYNCS|nr:hypothetical protein Ccrd_005145 [Cynara cardunculus var. scolymus]
MKLVCDLINPKLSIFLGHVSLESSRGKLPEDFLSTLQKLLYRQQLFHQLQLALLQGHLPVAHLVSNALASSRIGTLSDLDASSMLSSFTSSMVEDAFDRQLRFSDVAVAEITHSSFRSESSDLGTTLGISTSETESRSSIGKFSLSVEVLGDLEVPFSSSTDVSVAEITHSSFRFESSDLGTTLGISTSESESRSIGKFSLSAFDFTGFGVSSVEVLGDLEGSLPSFSSLPASVFAFEEPPVLSSLLQNSDKHNFYYYRLKLSVGRV